MTIAVPQDGDHSLVHTAIQALTRSTRIVCPVCGPERKKANEPTLSVTIDGNSFLYQCWHCHIAGAYKPMQERHRPQRAPVQQITLPPAQMNEVQLRCFLANRGLEFSPEQIRALPLAWGKHYFQRFQAEREAIGFVYGDPAHPTAIKWRPNGEKTFSQDGSAKEFYNLASARQKGADLKVLVLTEGELDALTALHSGLPDDTAALSCPNGAPLKVSDRRVSPEEDVKFGFIWDARDVIEKAERIVLATDADAPGEALREELARRIGRAKCWEVVYPEGCKDLNDVLRNCGKQAVLDTIQHAQPMPLEGVYSASDYRLKIEDLFDVGLGRGLSTGYANVDDLFTIAEGQLSIVTGFPGSGKSEFVDQMMINLAQNHHWKFAVCSFENPPHIHIVKMAEKIVRKPFFNGTTSSKMSKPELAKAIDFVNDHFVFLENRDGDSPTVDSIIERTKQAVMRMGVRGLVIDPYNYISMNRNGDDSETYGISAMLSKVATFAKAYGLHIWFVAHPAKMAQFYGRTPPVPKGQEISGSAAWHAKADLGITVHRSEDKPGVSEIHCWKSRLKWIGKIGQTELAYDIPTGTYSPNYAPNYNWTAGANAPRHYTDDDLSDLDDLAF